MQEAQSTLVASTVLDAVPGDVRPGAFTSQGMGVDNAR